MPIKKKKKVTLTKAISSPTKRYSPREISEFKNRQNQAASKAAIRLLSRPNIVGSKNLGGIVKNGRVVTNASIKYTNQVPKPKVRVVPGTRIKRGIARNTKVDFTPGLPTKSQNKFKSRTASPKQQQYSELVAFQRKKHAQTIGQIHTRSGYISPGKGGYPALSFKKRPERIPAIRSRNASVKRRKNG